MKTIFTLLLLFTTVIFTVDSQNNGYDIGDVATDFKLKNIDYKWVSLSDFKEAKGFIIVFTCNTCPYAVLLYSNKSQTSNALNFVARVLGLVLSKSILSWIQKLNCP